MFRVMHRESGKFVEVVVEFVFGQKLGDGEEVEQGHEIFRSALLPEEFAELKERFQADYVESDAESMERRPPPDGVHEWYVPEDTITYLLDDAYKRALTAVTRLVLAGYPCRIQPSDEGGGCVSVETKGGKALDITRAGMTFGDFDPPVHLLDQPGRRVTRKATGEDGITVGGVVTLLGQSQTLVPVLFKGSMVPVYEDSNSLDWGL